MVGWKSGIYLGNSFPLFLRNYSPVSSHFTNCQPPIYRFSTNKSILFQWYARSQTRHVTFRGFHQLRFCPLDKEDTLLFRNPGTSLVRGCLELHNGTIGTRLSQTNFRPWALPFTVHAYILASMPVGLFGAARRSPLLYCRVCPRGPHYYCVMFAVYVPSSELAALTIFTVKMNARARDYRKSVSRRWAWDATEGLIRKNGTIRSLRTYTEVLRAI